MTICPKCNAENRPEAAFCSRCGTILLVQPAPTKPFESEPVHEESIVVEPSPTEPQETSLSEAVEAKHPGTSAENAVEVGLSKPEPVPDEHLEQPVVKKAFTSREEGAKFGGHFQYQSLVYEDEHENLYTVTEICQPPDPCVRTCSNPDCRTVHVPTGTEQEKYCTICGSLLEETNPPLVLQEADSDRFGDQEEIMRLNLAHPNVHPPIAVFQETMPEGVRYCMVTPYSLEVPASPEISQVLEWGLQLANGLDYLHSHGVAFGAELDSTSFGLVGNRIIWRNFNSVRVLPMLADREKINNVRLLALSLYSWITGKSTYITDTSLHPSLNQLFQQALEGEGFTSGTELAEQIRAAMNSSFSTFNLVYQTGQRTHPGQMRSNNEDSLLCLTLSSVKQGISQPIGLYAVADGMGGHDAGDLASSLAIQVIAQKASAELFGLQNRSENELSDWIKRTVQAANQAVFEARQAAKSDMGSTLACALMMGDKVCIAHIGDSRVYQFREGALLQLTTDHSVVQQLVTIGKISSKEAREHPQRNVIYRSLGENSQVEADVSIQRVQPGDMLLICSDGLNSMLEDEKIQILIRESPSPQVACDYLVDAANLAGGEDNISIILINVISA